MDQGLVNKTRIVRILTGISINLIIAIVHIFRLGSYLSGEAYILYYSYASDIIIPIGVYFLLCMNDMQIQILEKWYVKALGVFILATFIEIMQAFGIYLVGITFDVIDIVMFGIGVLIAVFLDKIVFESIIPYYKLNRASG
jgi:hypothetical protein